MDRKTKAIVAAVAGASLLIGGGGTWALWSDEAEVEGVQVTSGSMELTIDGPTTWYDVSSDRADAGGAPINIDGLFGMEPPPIAPASTGREIDPATFRFVPGDVLVGATKFSVEAEGDNIAYALKIASGHEAFAEFALLDETGSPVSLVKAPNNHYVVAPEGSGDDGFNDLGDVVVELADPEAVKGWTLLVGIYFRTDVEAGAPLTAAPSVVLSVTQVRPFDVEFDEEYTVWLTYAPDSAPDLVGVVAELMSAPPPVAESVVQGAKSGERMWIAMFSDEASANAAKAALENAGGGVEIVVRATWPS